MLSRTTFTRGVQNIGPTNYASLPARLEAKILGPTRRDVRTGLVILSVVKIKTKIFWDMVPFLGG
jgi:hypothetical protein